VSRFLVFAGAVALSLTQPALSLANPPPAMPLPVFHAPLPVYHPVAPAPARASHAAARSGGDFRVPFEGNVRPQPTTPLLLPPHRYSWFGWTPGWSQGFFAPQFPCFGSNSFWGPLDMLAASGGTSATPADTIATPGITLGSLVDAQSRNFLTTYPSYSQAYGETSADTSAPLADTSAPSFQYGFQSAGCGPSYSFGF
jgi:hypothetical protein